MTKFNLCNNRTKLAHGVPVMLRDDLNSRELEQNDFMGGYNPYGRQRKSRDQQDNNKNQLGDNEHSSIALGPGAGSDGIGSDDDRGEDARKQFDQWFGDHTYLWERQDAEGGYDSSLFMTGGDGIGEPAIDAGGMDQKDSPLAYSAKIQRQNDPAGYRDNPSPHSRLPGYGGGQVRPETQRERDHKTVASQSVKTFNQSRRKQQITPLDITWAHLKKGSAE